MRPDAISDGYGGATPAHIHRGAEGGAPPTPRVVPGRPVAPRLSGLGPPKVAT